MEKLKRALFTVLFIIISCSVVSAGTVPLPSWLQNHGKEEAKDCYEKILQLDPKNTLAFIDFADYWKRNGDYKQALFCYEKAISILRTGYFCYDSNSELEEAIQGKAELLKEMNQ